MVSRLGLSRTQKRATLIVSAVVIATVFASEHATSQMALVGAAVVFALFRARPKLALPILAAGWVAANLLVVPAASVLYNAGVHRASWLPESARHRIVIWRYTSEQISKAPLLGAGISTARAVHEAQATAAPLAPGTKFALSTGLHSHNAYLQIWYEAGVVGVCIMLGLGLLILRGLRRFPTDIQPYLATTFAACALIVATAYSIWAPWFMASLAMTAIFAGLGAALPYGGAIRRTRAGRAD
jgi:O-antigen ligase